MGAYADYAAFKAALSSPSQVMRISKALTARHQENSYWLAAPFGGSAPTTAVACDRTTVGALGQKNGSNDLRLISVEVASFLGAGTPTFGNVANNPNPCLLMLCDRLSHQGGLSWNTTGSQTTNLPTAALTRYTSGEGVQAMIETYTAGGFGTLPTITGSYTNQAGTSGRAFTGDLGQTGTNESQAANAVIPLTSMQASDTGVRSVESITVSIASGVAGSFGVTLFKPLAFIPVLPYSGVSRLDTFLSLGCQLEPILPDACLFWVATFLNGNANKEFEAVLRFDDR
jgi:hypothetical protein